MSGEGREIVYYVRGVVIKRAAAAFICLSTSPQYTRCTAIRYTATPGAQVHHSTAIRCKATPDAHESDIKLHQVNMHQM